MSCLDPCLPSSFEQLIERLDNDEFDLVAGVEGHETKGLGMHEPHLDPPVGKSFHYAQMSSVDVDGIVMGAGE